MGRAVSHAWGWGIDDQVIRQLADDELRPLLHQAAMGTLPPFKAGRFSARRLLLGKDIHGGLLYLLFAWLLSAGPHQGLGASGMVTGALGLLAVHSLSLWRKTPHAAKFIISNFCGGVMLFLLLGVSPGTDVLAHAGGFVSGLLQGWLLALLPATRKPAANLAAGFLFALLVFLPWWLALRHPG